MLRYQVVSAHSLNTSCAVALSLSLLSPQVCANVDMSVYRCVLCATPIDKRYMPLHALCGHLTLCPIFLWKTQRAN